MATNDIHESISDDRGDAHTPLESNVDNEEVRKGETRTRQKTDKFVEWRLDTYQQHLKKAVSSWRRHATKIERLLSDSKDEMILRTARDAMDVKMNEVVKCYQELSDIENTTETFTTYDKLEQDNYRLSKDISDKIRALEQDETRSTVTKSTSSKTSRHSQVVAIAEAASLRAKLQFMDIEAQKKAEFERSRIELEKVQTQKEYSMVQAKIEAVERIEFRDKSSSEILDLPSTSKEHLVADYVQAHSQEPLPSEPVVPMTQRRNQLNSLASIFTPATTAPVVTNFVENKNSTAPSNVPTLSQQHRVNTYESHRGYDPINDQSKIYYNATPHNELDGVLKVLTEQVSLSRLPPPEPGVYFGDPLAYPAWRSAFQTLIGNKGIPPNERIYYLKKYLSGQAKESVEGFLLLTTDDAYNEAMILLEQRYGNSFAVANGFRNKLDAWPKIPPRDGYALRKYSDYLKQCEIAMRSISSLRILNDDQENRKMLMKLPEWLTLRWGRIVSQWKDNFQNFPPFMEFVKFIAKEAQIACDPVTSLQSLKSNITTPSPCEIQRSIRRTYATETRGIYNRNDNKNICTFCKRRHNIDDCYIFLAKTLEERKDFAKINGLCFGCLEHGHRSRNCKQKLKCKTCSKQHPTSLHGDVRKAFTQETTTKSAISHVGLNRRFNVERTCKCSMILPVWLSHSKRPEREILVYALLDTQSDTTFVLDSTCDDLGVDGPNVKLLLSTMTSENKSVNSRRLAGLMVRGFDSQQKISLPVTYSRDLMPSNRNHIPTPDTARRWPHLKRIADKLMPLSDAPVGLLIGYNCSRALAPRDVIIASGDEPYAQRTDLGWGIVGIVHVDQDENDDPIGDSHHILEKIGTTESNAQISLLTRIKEVITPVDVAHMMEMDFSERSSDEKGPSFDDLRFLKLMKEGIHRTKDQHYEMPLPLRNPDHLLPNNRNLSMRRLRQLESRFRRDDKYRHNYWTFMQKMIEDGHAERVPENELQCEDGFIWYIPHHGIYNPKKPNKIRVVFDCSAKCRGESLNDNLLQGPDLMNKLVGVLCRFRKEQVAFVCDIEQMFFQFRVNEAQRNLLRFLWWDPLKPNGEPVEYRMKVHLFGAVSSPACANFGLKQTAIDFEKDFGADAANFLKNDFYVDDGLKSVESVEKAINLITKSRAMCQSGHLRLHKFISNHREVISSIPVKDRVQELLNIDLFKDDLPFERTLGIFWCVQSDVFKFRIILQDKPLTRRGILSTISSIYDPLGFLAPVLLTGKQILQELCKDKADWDTEISDHLRPRWEQWRNSLSLLDTHEIPRCVKSTNLGSIKKVELHHFSDASTSGYGQCSYLRLVDTDDQVNCTLVMGKARVAPLKTVTIPRLELAAAVVSVRVSTLLTQEFEYSDITNIFWTDSKIVLGYISNESRRFHVFVSNRVQHIRNHTNMSQWRYVNTQQNPADEGSRGISVKDLLTKSMWTKGPPFLWEKDIPSATEECQIMKLQSDDPEVKQAIIHVTQVECTRIPLLKRLDRFSSWKSARRAIAVCLRLTSKHKAETDQVKQPVVKCPGVKYRPCNVGELAKAETEIIRLLQRSEFEDELEALRASTKQNKSPSRKKSIKKSSPLYRLNPYMDTQGIIRIGGRLNKSNCANKLKHPVILPKRHHLTKLIIRYVHEQVQHQGRGITVNAIRSSGYWILGCGSEVSYYISRCVKCRKLRSSVQEQKMADLPEDRVNPAPPFTYCGVDCFGPWYIKEGRKELKRYGVLFTCMASRAIHIETVNSMTTDSFINSLRRFIAIRGPIRQLRSDQGTNFVGAANELKEALSSVDQERIRDFLLPHNCDYFDFKLNTPCASHTGGVWERQIRTVRNVIASILDQDGHQLDDESLRTLLCEVMAIVNGRPLTTENLNDGNSPIPITPNHLLTMKSKVILPPPGAFVREDVYCKKRWRRVQHLANQFWHRWKREYLQIIQIRQKWTRTRRDMQVGDVVILKDETQARNQWSLARVVEIFPSEDGHVRSVKLCVADTSRNCKGKRVNSPTYLNRPIQKLVLLLENE